MNPEVPPDRLDRAVEQMRAKFDDEQTPRIRVVPGRPRLPRSLREPVKKKKPRRRRRRRLSHTTLWDMRHPLTPRELRGLWGPGLDRGEETALHLSELLGRPPS